MATTAKYVCKEHKRKFSGGQGYAAHLRRFHPGVSFNGHPEPSPPPQPPPPQPQPPALLSALAPRQHLDSALLSIDAHIHTAEAVLKVLREQRRLVVAAQDADGEEIPF